MKNEMHSPYSLCVSVSLWRFLQSKSREIGLSFFHERAYALFVIFGHSTAQVRFGLAVEHRSEICRRREVHIGFHIAVARQRAMGDSRGDFCGLRREILMRDHAVDQADAMGLRRVDDFGEEKQLLSLRRASVML